MLFAANTMRGQRGEGGHLGKVAEKMRIFENEAFILEEYDEKLEETPGGGTEIDNKLSGVNLKKLLKNLCGAIKS